MDIYMQVAVVFIMLLALMKTYALLYDCTVSFSKRSDHSRLSPTFFWSLLELEKLFLVIYWELRFLFVQLEDDRVAERTDLSQQHHQRHVDYFTFMSLPLI